MYQPVDVLVAKHKIDRYNICIEERGTHQLKRKPHRTNPRIKRTLLGFWTAAANNGFICILLRKIKKKNGKQRTTLQEDRKNNNK